MNILVTGANGQLGNEIRIITRESDDHYVFTDVNQVEGVETVFLDITDLEAVRVLVAERRIDVIVNCAAYTNVDAAESNEALAERLNAEAPENLDKAMKAVNGLLVQISTDYVFGKEPYNVPCQE
ncbi:sugar nucleotide-binding protein, partial [Escherichia coli]|nr:sugar nucleotide-binding protein [Escherichia coli]